MSNRKRVLSILLAAVMLLSVFSAGLTVFAETTTDPLPEWILDSNTKSGWIGTYGEDGYVLCGWDNKNDVTKLPSYVSGLTYKTEDRSGGYVAQTGATLEYGLPNVTDPNGTRKVAYRFDDKRQTLQLTVTDNVLHQVTLYVCSENDQGKKQTIQAFQKDTTTPVSQPYLMENLMVGKYVTLFFQGSIDIVLNNENYSPLRTNTIVNGIFFDTGSIEDVLVDRITVHTADGNDAYKAEQFPLQMSAVVSPSYAPNKEVTWSVQPADGASITESGLLTLTQPGKYTVTASATDGSGVTETKSVTLLDPSIPSWSMDTTTRGDWMGNYGRDGYVLCGWNSGRSDREALPYYIDSVTYHTQDRSGRYQAREGSTYIDGLSDPDSTTGNRKITYYFDDKCLTTTIKVNDDDEHTVTLYIASENDNGKTMSVQLFRAGTTEPLSEKVIIKDMPNGKYITTTFTGSIDIVMNNENYKPVNTNALVNAFFFDSDYGDNVPVKRVSAAPVDGEIFRSSLGSVQLNAVVQPSFAADPSVLWSVISDDSGVASVDENGLLTIHKAGIFTVKAQSISNPEVFDQLTMVSAEDISVPEKAEISTLADRFAVIQNKQVRVLFDTQTGYYSVYDQATQTPYVLNAYCQVNDEKSTAGYTFTASDITGEDFSGKQLRLVGEKVDKNSLVLDISLTNDDGDILLDSGIVNRSGQGVKVMQMYPMVANHSEKGGIFVGPDPEQHHAVLTGEGNWTVPQVKQGVNTSSKNNLMISYRDNPHMESFLMGGLTTYEFQNTIDTLYDASSTLVNRGRKSINAKIRIYDNTGRLVDDGQLYVGDRALLNFTEKNPYQSLERYAKKQAKAMDVQLLEFDPYIYECLWYVNWFTPNANNANFAVQEVKDLYTKGLANYARPNLRVEPDSYVNPNEQLWWDDAHWLQFGHLSPEYPTAKAWIAAMQQAGGEGGLYMQASYRSNDYCAQYPEHMLYNNELEGPDYTDPDFIAHMQEVYANLKDAGVRSIFYDYAGQYKGTSGGYLLDKTGGFEDKYATAVSAYRNIFALPKQYIGRDVRITENSWEYSGSDLAIGLIDIQRNIHDTNEFNTDIARPAINQWYRHRTTKLLYSDVKVFENNDEDLRRAQITGTAFFFGKMTLGESVNRMSDAKIKDVGRSVPFPINGISARPVGLFEEANATTNPDVYDYKFNSEFDDHILLLWNQTGEAKDISVQLGEDTAFGGIGLNAEKSYDVWDFWNWQYIGRVQGSDLLTQNVRKNEMRTLAVREARNQPYLLSTNRHLLQGDFDAYDFNFDAKTRTLTGTFDIVANDSYKAIIPLGDLPYGVTGFSVDNPDVTASYEVFDEAGYVEITLDAAENQTVGFTMIFETDGVEISAPESALTNELFPVTLVTKSLPAKLTILNEKGSKIGLGSISVTTDEEGVHTLTVLIAVGTAGEQRTFTVHDGDLLLGQFSLAIRKFVPPTAIVSLSAPESAKAKQSFGFSVVTTKDLIKGKLENEFARGIGLVKVSSVVEGDYRITLYEAALDTPASAPRTLTFKADFDKHSEWPYTRNFDITIAP